MSKDTIYRQAAIDICRKTKWNGADDYLPLSAREIESEIRALPSAEQQVMGRWIWINDKTKDSTYRLRCSLCHGRGYDEKHKYCPHCGKRMKVEA